MAALSGIGTKLPFEFETRLLGAMPGNRDTEKWFHMTFRSARANGEWFEQTAAIRAFLASVGFLDAVRIRGFAERLEAELIEKAKSAQGPIHRFICERCVADSDLLVPRRMFAKELRTWAGRPDMPDREISRLIRDAGFTVEPAYYRSLGETVRCIKGLWVRPAEEETRV